VGGGVGGVGRRIIGAGPGDETARRAAAGALPTIRGVSHPVPSVS
jgi:hypothetical protein